MLDQLHAALLGRIAEIDPEVAASDYGAAVGCWREEMQFAAHGGSVEDGWDCIRVVEGVVIGELIAGHAIETRLLASLFDGRLHVELPADAEVGDVAYGGHAKLHAIRDALVETDGAAVLVSQLSFDFRGGLYRRLDDIMAPTEVWIGRAPLVGAGHEADYTLVAGGEE